MFYDDIALMPKVDGIQVRVKLVLEYECTEDSLTLYIKDSG